MFGIFLPIFYAIFRFVKKNGWMEREKTVIKGWKRLEERTELQQKSLAREKIALGVFGSLIAGIYECFLLALLSLLVGWW